MVELAGIVGITKISDWERRLVLSSIREENGKCRSERKSIGIRKGTKGELT